MRWAVPLLCTVLAYGLAQGLYKQVALSGGGFCLLFVLVKTAVNWGSWALLSCRPLREPGAGRFYGWALFGQLVNGLGWIAYFLALERGPAALVGTVTAAYTGVTVVLALLFLGERPARRQLLGVGLLVLCGMLLAHGGEDSGPGRAGWLALSLLTVLLWGTAVCLFKHAYDQPGADDYRFFLVNWAGASLTLLPYGLAAGAAVPGEVLGLGLLVVLLYALGDLTLFAALRRGPATFVTPLSGLYPIPTLAWAALVLQEPISGLQWLAVVVTLAGILLVAWESPRR